MPREKFVGWANAAQRPISHMEGRTTNKVVILRRPRALARGRLEGCPQALSFLPSFETRAFGALLRMTFVFVALLFRRHDLLRCWQCRQGAAAGSSCARGDDCAPALARRTTRRTAKAASTSAEPGIP